MLPALACDHSGVLAIHAATLPSGKVMFFAGSGNNQVRVASPDYGNLAKGIYTSVTWDPAAPAAGGANFFHPDTITGPDAKPFDFFCGGDTFLPDGTLLSAGGNLAYPGKGRPGAVGFNPAAQQWHHLGHKQQGRWYPTLLPLADGRVLAVSGLNENGALNTTFEIYTPGTDSWHTCRYRRAACSSACPCTRTCSCSAAAWSSYPAGRMDDPNPQCPVLMGLTTSPVTITGVPGLGDPATRTSPPASCCPGAGPAGHDPRRRARGRQQRDGQHGHCRSHRARPAYAPAATMSLPRMHLNAVLLPDHTVFASGGTLSREDRTVARLQSDIYDPATNTSRIGATATVVRMYHSIALLLPRRPGRHRSRQ